MKRGRGKGIGGIVWEIRLGGVFSLLLHKRLIILCIYIFDFEHI